MEALEGQTMKLFAKETRRGRRSGFSGLLLVCLLTLGTTSGFSSSPGAETIQATYAKDGKVVGVTLMVYNYSTSADLQVLSLAFRDGQEKGLATALSKTKAVGLCSITGGLSFDIAFIQMVVTPSGRQITFITNRPLQADEVKSSAESESFDMLVGEFDINDNDNSKSTGFLYPASRLVMDERGELHYDLAGSPWPLVNVFDSNRAQEVTERRPSDAVSPQVRQP
ncbi:MAG: hypothetical protein ABR928_10835 [Terracidiphilus sp.]